MLFRSEQATASMGQGITLTPIQLLSAFSSVINGGYLMEPYVISEVLDADGNLIEEILPNKKRQVISEDTSDVIRRYLRSTITEGTGGNANIGGYSIGGKTGTAEKLPRGSGKYIVSFVGYAPIENPEVIAFVLFDEIDDTAGAPTKAFYEMMQNILPYLGIEAADANEVNETITAIVPSVEGLNLYDGINTLTLQQLQYEIIGVGTNIISQYPSPGVKLPKESTIKVYVETDDPSAIMEVPDLKGMGIEEANQTLEGFFTIQGSGEGKIVSQIPLAGTKIETGNKIIVQTSE